MASLMHRQPYMVSPPPIPMVQDVLQKLNSIGADFLWMNAMYQEQMRINKGLKNDITNVSTSHELLRQANNLAEHKITSLESLLYNSRDDSSDKYTELSSGNITEEQIKDLQEEISYLKSENRRIHFEREVEMSRMAEATRKYEETLAHASDMLISSAKRIAEFEALRESGLSDQNCNSIKSEHTEV